MQNKLFVGNLSYQATAEDLNNLFAQFGKVQNVNIISDRHSGQSKGFAFVEMSTGEEAEKALTLNGSDFLGRNINVSEARPQEKRPGGGGMRRQMQGGSGGGRYDDRKPRRDGFGRQDRDSRW